MPNRVIKDSVRQSGQIDSLTWFQEVVFYRLIVTVDDFGRYYANPQIVKSELFPTKEDLAKKDVAVALDKLEEVGLIKRYEVDGIPYLEFTKWEKHQQRRATKSKFPDVNGKRLKSSDINCNQLISSDSNGNQMSPYSKSNTNTKSSTRNARAHEDDSPQEDDPLSAEDARKIQADHDEIFDRLKYAGFDLTAALMDRAVNLYAEYGKEAVLEAIEGCIKASKPRLDYLLGCLKNAGKPKEEPGKQYMDDDEERDIVSRMFW